MEHIILVGFRTFALIYILYVGSRCVSAIDVDDSSTFAMALILWVLLSSPAIYALYAL